MMGRSPCCSMEGFHHGAWTKHEDIILSDYIRIHGDDGGWTNLALKAGLKRSGKSCRLRWLNYVRPDIKRGNISPDEEELIIRLHRLLGNRWSLIAGRLPGRTDNEIKNYWNTCLSKKLRLSMKQSQTTSKSCSPLPNHVFKTSAVRITMDSTVTRPIGFKGYESSNNDSNSDEAFKSCNVKETTTEPIAFAMSGVHVAEGEGRNQTISSLADEESRPHSDDFAGDTATLDDTLFDLNELSFSQWNPLFSPWDWSIDPHGLEEFYRVAAAEMNEFEDIIQVDRL